MNMQAQGSQAPCGGQTMVEKILSAHAGHKAFAGDMLMATVDGVMVTDGSGPLTLDFYEKMQGKGVFDPAKILLVLDHYVPCPNDQVARLHDGMRRFAAAGKGILYDLGEGICHQLLPEQGHIRPGALVIGGDSHSTTYGAFNCLGTGLGSSDLAFAMIRGKTWFKVPPAIRVELSGALPANTYAKDLALTLVGLLGADGGTYRAIEFCGPGLASLGIAERMTVCNLMVETGAKCALMPCDARLREHIQSLLGYDPGKGVEADANAAYVQHLHIALDTLEPVMALPHQVDTIRTVREMAGTPIHMGVIGTCTNGRVEDFAAALQIMGTRKLAPGFELLVVPASRAVALEAMRQGLLAAFMERGATILPPGCGPCCGSSPGIPSDGEQVLSTANRNFIGRMGNVKASIYLGSPATVAAAAVHGQVCLPEVCL